MDRGSAILNACRLDKSDMAHELERFNETMREKSKSAKNPVLPCVCVCQQIVKEYCSWWKCELFTNEECKSDFVLIYSLGKVILI